MSRRLSDDPSYGLWMKASGAGDLKALRESAPGVDVAFKAFCDALESTAWPDGIQPDMAEYIVHMKKTLSMVEGIAAASTDEEAKSAITSGFVPETSVAGAAAAANSKKILAFFSS